MRPLAAALLLLVVVPVLGQRMDYFTKGTARCSACRAVTATLVDRLDKEKPRNHLDMRHRLDKHGNRYGKVIDYKLSELRVIELLEGLCSKLPYEFIPANKTTGAVARWIRNSDLGINRNFDLEAMKEQQRLLENYCADLIERHEDEVAEAIRKVKVDADGISDYLCYELSEHCSTRQEEEETAAEAEAKQTEQRAQEQPASSEEQAGKDNKEAVGSGGQAEAAANDEL